MGDVTRRWPRSTALVLAPPVSTRRDRAERDAATVAALEAYLRDAQPQHERAVDVRL
ncbi:MAG: hypothetical protein JWO60_2244 [Frankiales bacterium]|nr:hypothetical protein [Frankiales bacterium]